MLLTWFRKISLIPFSILFLKSKKRLLSCNYNLLSIAIGEAGLQILSSISRNFFNCLFYRIEEIRLWNVIPGRAVTQRHKRQGESLRYFYTLILFFYNFPKRDIKFNTLWTTGIPFENEKVLITNLNFRTMKTLSLLIVAFAFAFSTSAQSVSDTAHKGMHHHQYSQSSKVKWLIMWCRMEN